MTKSALYTAVLSASSLLLHSVTASAFLSPPSRRLISKASCAPLASSAIDDGVPSDAAIALDEDDDNNSILRARNDLLALSKTLSSNSPSGTFLTLPADKRELRKAIQNLEAVSSASTGDKEKEMLLGDWTLIATASLPCSNIRQRMDSNQSTANNKLKGWFDKKSLFGNGDNPIQKSIRKTVKVTQRIRNDGPSDSDSVVGEINRVDNVIEITPLDTLESIIPTESPFYNLLGSVNVNPLQVKKTKVVLVHTAEVESVAPVLRTKIAWTSSILNVAGSSQFLEPEGEDVFGVNNLLGEFSGAGTFDTPFVDSDVRVSRTSGPVVEQLRVFVRQGNVLEEEDAEVRSSEEETAVDSSDTDEGEDVGGRAKKVVDAAASLAENAREVINKDMESVTTAVGDKMDDVVCKVQDAVEDDLKSIGEAVEGVQSAIKGEGGDLGEAIGEVAEAVVKGAIDVRDIVEEDRVELEGELREAMDAMVADVQDSVEEDLEKMRDLATGTDEKEEETEKTEDE